MKAATVLLLGSVLLTTSFGQVIPMTPTEANLRAAASAGGLTTFTTDGTITLNTPVAILTDVTFDANGYAVIIDGANVTTLFQVAATGKLTLKGLALVNGRAKGADSPVDGGSASPGAGGAIQNSGGEVTAISCSFSNNIAVGGSGATPGRPVGLWNNGGSGSGGAIYQTGGSLTIQGSSFVANSAAGGPGSGPEPAYGGAVCSLDGVVTLEDTTFTNNKISGGSNYGLHGNAEAYGGAIYIQDGSLHAQQIQFTGNLANGVANAPTYGGAVASKNGALTITDSLFSGNTALGGGGAYLNTGLVVPGHPSFGGALNVGSNATASVRSSTFVNNTSQGGLDLRSPSDGSARQYGASYGGAVAVQGNAEIINSTFVGNSAYLYPSAFGTSQVADGGAIYNTGSSALT